MNEYGMTAWLADQLVRKSEFTGDRNKYEMYDLEYSLALFMNLSRSPSAVRACKSRARNLFKSLTVFLTSLDVDVSIYIYIVIVLISRPWKTRGFWGNEKIRNDYHKSRLYIKKKKTRRISEIYCGK